MLELICVLWILLVLVVAGCACLSGEKPPDNSYFGGAQRTHIIPTIGIKAHPEEDPSVSASLQTRTVWTKKDENGVDELVRQVETNKSIDSTHGVNASASTTFPTPGNMRATFSANPTSMEFSMSKPFTLDALVDRINPKVSEERQMEG